MFALLFSCLLAAGRPLLALAGQLNVTIDDHDSSIVYSPQSAWFSSGNASGCSFCLAPQRASVAFSSTWHHGLHIVPTTDGDDQPHTDPTPTSTSSPTSTPASDPDQDQGNGGANRNADNDGDNDADDKDKDNGGKDVDGDGKDPDSSGKDKDSGGDSDADKNGSGDGDKDDGKDADSDSKGGKGSSNSKRNSRRDFDGASSTVVPGATITASPFVVEKLDSDDPGFVDQPVFAQLNFTGKCFAVLTAFVSQSTLRQVPLFL